MMNFSDKTRSFDKSEFDDENFSVDEWIQRKRYSAPLDVLRDDLGAHLKHLRSCLIELINQDYGQFVNLSSNLVGLDGKILNIIGPLLKTKRELQNVHGTISSTLTSLQEEMNKRRELRAYQIQLRCLQLATESLESSSKYLKSVPEEIQTSSDFATLCLVCDEIGETKFLLEQCSDSEALQDSQSKLSETTTIVLIKLAGLLEVYGGVVSSSELIIEDNETIIKSLLHMYAELNAETNAEEVFITKILKPKCEIILSKKGNSTALLDEIERFISNSPLIKFSRKILEFPWLSNFDFIGRAVFPQIINILVKHFPHIWSPSIPDSFHSNWTRCEAFIEVIESTLPSAEHLEHFRNSTSFKDFISKWQFPVYFQLRFHTLAIELETALDNISAPSNTSEFKLNATNVTIGVIKQCWDKDKIFISYLAGRFIKASALFTSRYLKAACDTIVDNNESSLELLVNLYHDINFAQLVVEHILKENIAAHFPNASQSSTGSGAKEFLDGFAWNEVRKNIEKRLGETIISQVVGSMSSVSEVPRLFRRTNRDAPTKHSDYIDTGILQPIQCLQNIIKASSLDELWDIVGTHTANEIALRFQAQVREVLTSVQRMEDSLKRLKKIKGQSQGGTTTDTAAATNEAKVLSDDDKIRCQIQLDVNQFLKKIKELCPQVDTSSMNTIFDKNSMKR